MPSPQAQPNPGRTGPTGAVLPDAPEVMGLIVATMREQLGAGHPADPKPKPDGSWVTSLDWAMQQRLRAELAERWPQYGFLGEEQDLTEQLAVCREERQGFWVLDPLDGTTNFVHGFPLYGVSLALVTEGVVRLACIYDPVRDERFSAVRGRGASLNGQPLAPNPPERLSACLANVDYAGLLAGLAAALVRSPPYRAQRNLGSSVLEWCWLAAGRLQLTLHGGQKLWDYAAGHLILEEAGGAASSLSGRPLDGRKPGKTSIVAAASPDLHRAWLAWLGAHAGPAPQTTR